MAHITYQQYRRLHSLEDSFHTYEAYTQTLWYKGDIYKDQDTLRFTDSGEPVPKYQDIAKPPHSVEIELCYCETSDITFIMQHCYEADGTPFSTTCVGWHYGTETAIDTQQFLGNLGN